MKFIKLFIIGFSLILLFACLPMDQTKGIESPKEVSIDEQMNRLTSQIISSFNQSNVQKIAVIEFADLEGNVNQLGRFIAEELITRIFTTGRFNVVERNLLNKVLAEQQLGMTGYIDQESAISLGQLLGVEAIVTGSITDLGSNIKINARLISTQTGSVFAVASVNVPKNDTIRKLMGENIESTSKLSDIKSGFQPESSGLKPPVVQHGVQFELQKCFYSNSIVSFVFNITNLDMDKEISILNYTRDDVLRFFDENGNEYQKAEIFLGTHRAASNREGVSQITMIQDVGTQCIMKFHNVSKKPQTVKRLDLLLEIPDLKNVFTITFREIQVGE